ncbi:chitinase 1-like [Gossypium australe]|uniref:Chitinase 1-like n=1 Tax=Gossypium australe TaxID=47621 RepID=A0A5B6VC87_9ROSI|nr:chitinase 1-like [Gossypium australe]
MKTKKLKLLGYSDSDWIGSTEDMKTVVNQAIWLRKLLNDLNVKHEEAIEVKCDNQSNVGITKNPMFHGRTKHFKNQVSLCERSGASQ